MGVGLGKVQGLAKNRWRQILIIVYNWVMCLGENVSEIGFMLNRQPCDLVLQENLYIMFSLSGLLNLLYKSDSELLKQFIII